MPAERLAPHGRVTFETAAKQASNQVPMASPANRGIDLRRFRRGDGGRYGRRLAVCDFQMQPGLWNRPFEHGHSRSHLHFDLLRHRAGNRAMKGPLVRKHGIQVI